MHNHKSRLQLKERLGKYSVFLTPAGAGIAIICFFLPWVRVSCGTITVEASGARIGGILWLVLIAATAVAGLFVYFYFWRKREINKLRLLTLIGSGLALIIIIYKFISAFASDGEISFSDIGSVIRYGAIGEFLGLLTAIGGAVLIKFERAKDRSRSYRRFSYLYGMGRRNKEGDQITRSSNLQN